MPATSARRRGCIVGRALFTRFAGVVHAGGVEGPPTDRGIEPGVPGWYRDPAGETELRLWDGQRWTAQTRGPDEPGPSPADQKGVGEDDAGSWDGEWYGVEDARRGGPRPGSRILAIVVVVFLVLGVFEVIHGISGGTTNTNAFSPALGIATTTVPGAPAPEGSTTPTPIDGSSAAGPVATVPIDPCDHQYGAEIILQILQLREGFPVAVVADESTPSTIPRQRPAPRNPGAPCTALDFTDSRGGGHSHLAVFSSADDAATAAKAAATLTSAPPVVIGPAVLQLDPSLSPLAGEYNRSIDRIVKGQ